MDSFWGNIFKKDRAAVRETLREVPMFRDLTDHELGCVERVLHRRQYMADEIIFSQGTLGAGMYIIVTGTVGILREPEGREVAELSDGEFFGELALLEESARPATAVARTPCKVLGFFQSDLFGLMERNPRLGSRIVMKLARIIGRRLHLCNERTYGLEGEIATLRAELAREEGV